MPRAWPRVRSALPAREWIRNPLANAEVYVVTAPGAPLKGDSVHFVLRTP